MSGDREPTDRTDPNASASFIAAMTRDLAQIARRAGMPVLAYMLEMAQIEAEANLGKAQPRAPMDRAELDELLSRRRVAG